MENQMYLMKNTYCHRISLIQHLVTRVIPLPLPLNHPNREAKCFWASQPMRYETQADLLRLLDLLNRHYAACSLSLRVTRSFDAVRMLTSACIAAVTDVVLRTRACDIPSLLSLHYSGQAEGPVHPFGFDAGYFRLESDNAKLADPYLQVGWVSGAVLHRFHPFPPSQTRGSHPFLCLITQVVRSQCLDYFTQLRNSLREQDIIFRFESSMEFGQGERALLDQLCLQMGFPRDDLASFLSGENPLVLDNFPELGFFRDIVYLFKALLAPSSESLPDLRPWRARDAALGWSYKADGGGFSVRGFGSKLKCAAFVKPEDLVNKGGFLTRLKGVFGLSKPRAPLSGADPSNLVGEKVETEDDVLHIKSLPTFEGRISPRQTELLLQYLTVPYLRIPLVLQFFACQEHIAALGCEQLQEVLDACLFEPGQWQADYAKEVPAVVPPPKRSHLATPCGLLFNELVRSPYNIMASLEKMLDLMLEHDTGRYSESSSPTILYVVRLVVQVESFILFLQDQERARELRGLACSPAHLAFLGDSQVRLRTKLNTVVFPMLEKWHSRVIKKKEELHKACVVSAHLAYLFRNLREHDLNYTNVSTLLCAQVFLTINFRFDVDISVEGDVRGVDREREEKDAVRRDLGVPQLEVFHVFTMHRAKMLAWLQVRPSVCY